jgi:hypothetical protein
MRWSLCSSPPALLPLFFQAPAADARPDPYARGWALSGPDGEGAVAVRPLKFTGHKALKN